MQPCAVCGGVQVDAAGFCARCRTFRGVPAQQPPAHPVHQQPAYGYPPPAAPAPPAGRARMFVIPLVALSVTLVVLVVAIVVVLARDTGRGADPVADPTSSRGTGSGTVDQCVVGSWKVTSHEEDTSVPNYGKLHITGGDGALITLRADGTGETDYGSGTSFRAAAAGQQIRIEVHGRVTYSYETRGDSVTQHDTRSEATVRLFVNDESYGNESPFTVNDNETSSYRCTGDEMTQSSALFTTKLAKQS